VAEAVLVRRGGHVRAKRGWRITLCARAVMSLAGCGFQLLTNRLLDGPLDERADPGALGWFKRPFPSKPVIERALVEAERVEVLLLNVRLCALGHPGQIVGQGPAQACMKWRPIDAGLDRRGSILPRHAMRQEGKVDRDLGGQSPGRAQLDPGFVEDGAAPLLALLQP